jgi:hypothetical protein
LPQNSRILLFMGHPFVFEYTNQNKFHVQALQSCLLFPYALP